MLMECFGKLSTLLGTLQCDRVSNYSLKRCGFFIHSCIREGNGIKILPILHHLNSTFVFSRTIYSIKSYFPINYRIYIRIPLSAAFTFSPATATQMWAILLRHCQKPNILQDPMTDKTVD